MTSIRKLESVDKIFIHMIYEFTHVMLKVCVKLAAFSAERPDP